MTATNSTYQCEDCGGCHPYDPDGPLICTARNAEPVTICHALPADVSETRFQDRVRILAQNAGYRVYHQHDSRRSEPGWVDVFCVRPGRAVAFELKVPGGRVSPAQQECIDLLVSAGIEARIVWPNDLAEIEEILQRGPADGRREGETK